MPRLVTRRGINTQGIDHGLPYEFRGYADVPPPNPSEPVFAAFGRTAEEAERWHMEIVRACNSHAELVAALETVQQHAEAYPEAAKLLMPAIEWAGVRAALNHAKQS